MRSHALAFALVICAAACGGGSKKPQATGVASRPGARPLYDRIGGVDAIKGIVKDFVEERVAKDARISARFAKVDTTHFEAMLTDQLCAATGGPCKYLGKTMKEAHAGMGISEVDFNALVEDLGETLKQFNVPAPEQKELLALLEPMRADVVEMK